MPGSQFTVFYAGNCKGVRDEWRPKKLHKDAAAAAAEAPHVPKSSQTEAQGKDFNPSAGKQPTEDFSGVEGSQQRRASTSFNKADPKSSMAANDPASQRPAAPVSPVGLQPPEGASGLDGSQLKGMGAADINNRASKVPADADVQQSVPVAPPASTSKRSEVHLAASVPSVGLQPPEDPSGLDGSQLRNKKSAMNDDGFFTAPKKTFPSPQSQNASPTLTTDNSFSVLSKDSGVAPVPSKNRFYLSKRQRILSQKAKESIAQDKKKKGLWVETPPSQAK